MKKILGSLAAALLFSAGIASAQVSFGDAAKFNDGWSFNLGDITGAADPAYDDAKWREVVLPHDWSVEGIPSPDQASCTGYLPGGIAWYRRHFTVEDSAAKHFIYFEGVYNRSEVYLNGHLLGTRPNGFISFMYDLTPYLREGDNVLAVRVDHSQSADTRWYCGSGIYRDVWMVSSPEIHLAQWGTAYRLDSMAGGKASVSVDVEVEKEIPATGRLEARVSLIDASGAKVAQTTARIKDLSAGNTRTTVKLSVPSAHAWSLENPYLYTLRTELVMGGKTIDQSEVKAGLRTLSFDPEHGFALNGKQTKVKGVCLHHDAGVLGAAVPEEVWRQRIIELKKMGANGIRCSHNPHSPVLYDLCDELGMLVMDEAFDEWEFPKRKWLDGWNEGVPGYQGTHDYFEEWCERDVKDMVRRDRNHASIFLWSIGNEVDYPNDPYSHPILDGDGSAISQPMYGGYKPDSPNAERIGKIAEKLSAHVRSIDTSRPVTGALAGVVMSNHTSYPDAVDVVGYNYTESRYDKDHELYPDRIIFGSETSRGVYSWTAVKEREHIFGHFLWTGTDYLGESHAFPTRGMGTGLLDYASFRKPGAQLRAALWCEEPFTYVGTGYGQWDSWNYEDGEEVLVTCYTNAAKARLMLNGKEVGAFATADEDSGAITWKIPYSAGTLRAEGCDENGAVISSAEIRTTGRPYAIKAEMVSTPKRNGERETALIKVTIVDENGLEVRLADNEISCRVEGPATVIGLESGNNIDMTCPKLEERRVYMGRLMAYVQTNKEDGAVTVSFKSPLLKSASVSF